MHILHAMHRRSYANCAKSISYFMLDTVLFPLESPQVFECWEQAQMQYVMDQIISS